MTLFVFSLFRGVTGYTITSTHQQLIVKTHKSCSSFFLIVTETSVLATIEHSIIPLAM